MDMPVVRTTPRLRAALVERWAEKALAVYPGDTVRIFLSTSDPFRNPVGGTIRRDLAKLLETVLSGEPLEAAHEALDEIIRIRSVQELTARESVRFVFELRDVVRESASAIPNLSEAEPWLQGRIEELALRAFDIYVGCREDVFRVRANQQQAYSRKLIERAERIINRRFGDTPADPTSEENGMRERGERP